jgi:hypothetical protein
MRAFTRIVAVSVALLGAACGDNQKQARPNDAGLDSQAFVGCIDPGLGRPPTDRLPCDLVPPGLAP